MVIGYKLHHLVMTELPFKVREVFTEGINNVISRIAFSKEDGSMASTDSRKAAWAKNETIKRMNEINSSEILLSIFLAKKALASKSNNLIYLCICVIKPNFRVLQKDTGMSQYPRG